MKGKIVISKSITFIIMLVILLLSLFGCKSTKIDREGKIDLAISEVTVPIEVEADFILPVKKLGVEIAWEILKHDYPVTLINPNSNKGSDYKIFNVVRLGSNYDYELKGTYSIGKLTKSINYEIRVLGTNPRD